MLQIKIRAYLEMSILTLDNNLGLNLCVIVIILEVEIW